MSNQASASSAIVSNMEMEETHESLRKLRQDEDSDSEYDVE